MKTTSTVALAASILAPFAVAQMDEDGVYHIGNIAISQDAISCLTECDLHGDTNDYTQGVCTDKARTDKMYSCINQQNCDPDNKPKASALISSICAVATPTGSIADFIAGAVFPDQSNDDPRAQGRSSDYTVTSDSNDDSDDDVFGFGAFFGKGGEGHDWANKMYDSNFEWASGPWTAWFGRNSACPEPTWSGWTSGPWETAPAWTSWDGCSASTTGSSVVTSTVSVRGSAEVTTTTDFGITVAAAPSSSITGTSGSATSASTSTSASASASASDSAAGDSAGPSLRTAGAAMALSALAGLALLL